MLSYLGIRNALAEPLLGPRLRSRGYRKRVQPRTRKRKELVFLGRHLRLELEHPDQEGAVRALKMFCPGYEVR